MRATWRDGAAILLAAVVVAIYGGYWLDWNLPMVSDIRIATLALGVVGLAMCIVGADPSAITSRTAYTVIASSVGVGALALVVMGLITASPIVFTALVLVIALLFVMATARHLLRGQPIAQPT